MKKRLIIFRLYDESYSDSFNEQFGNKMTLSVVLGEDNVLQYSYYGGWQDSGSSFSINNLQLQKSLPMKADDFEDVHHLWLEITNVLETGVGSKSVYSSDVLNKLNEKNTDGIYKTLSLLENQLQALSEDIPVHLKAKATSDLDTETFVSKVNAMKNKVSTVLKKL